MSDDSEQVGFTPKGARRVAKSTRKEERFDKLRYNGSGPSTSPQVPRQRVGWPVRVTDVESGGTPGIQPGVQLEFGGYIDGATVWTDGDDCWITWFPGGEAFPVDAEGEAFPVDAFEDKTVFVMGAAAAGGAGTLQTRNTNPPPVPPTAWFNTAKLAAQTDTGVEFTQGEAGEVGSPPGYDTLSNREATPTQWGVVTDNAQVWFGTKRIVNAVTVTPTVPDVSPYGFMVPEQIGVQRDDPVGGLGRYAYGSFLDNRYFVDADIGWNYTNTNTHADAKGDSDTYFYGTFLGVMSLYAAGGFLDLSHAGVSFVNGFRCRDDAYGFNHLDFYVDLNEATNDASAVAPVWSYPIRHTKHLLADDGFAHGGKRSGVDWYGLDTTVTLTIAGTDYHMKFVAGHLVQSWTGSPPPPAPPPPPPPPPGLGVIAGRAILDGSALTDLRSVALSGATTASTTLSATGHFGFSGVNPGSNTVTLSTPGGETSLYVVDGGSPTSGFAAPLTSAGGVNQVKFALTTVPPPPPPPPPSGSASGHVQNSLAAPLAARTVILSGANSATTTTDVSGNYSFSSLADGSTTATLTLSADTATHSVDGAGFSAGNAGTFTVAADSHTVDFHTTP